MFLFQIGSIKSEGLKIEAKDIKAVSIPNWFD